MNGAEQLRQFQEAGFTQDEIGKWSMEQRSRLSDAGFSDAEINEWFGQKEPDLGRVKKLVEDNLANYAPPALEGPAPASAEYDGSDFVKGIEAGLQMSVSGLIARGKAPSAVLPEDASAATRIASQMATVAGDLPFMAVGAALGGTVGAPTGPGAAVTAGAGAFGLPAGLRATLMDAYEKSEFTSFGDFWERASGIIWETTKGMITGGATVGAGLAAKAAIPAAAPAVVRAVTPTAAEIATMTTVGAGLEGHAPKAQDFVDAAIVVGGLKVATKGTKFIEQKLRDIYRETGAKPSDLAEMARKDPTVLQDLVSDNKKVPEAVIAAYHGSYHDFTKFDISKVGTGEGVQAFGHGIYFAENPKVAGSYRTAGLYAANTMADGSPVNTMRLSGAEGQANAMFSNRLAARLSTDDARLQTIKWLTTKSQWVNEHEALNRAVEFVKQLQPPKKGNLYKVEIPDSVIDNMIDWDNPISQQPRIRAAVNRILGSELEKMEDIGKWTGKEAYKRVTDYLELERFKHPDEVPANAAFTELGIVGIKYLDKGSRSVGEGTRNFVLFNVENARIIEKNGEKVVKVQEERRTDLATRKKVAEMAPEEMRAALLTDHLTELGNRRAYEETPRMAAQVAIDLDNLKFFNDRFGHKAGDELIKTIGSVIKKETDQGFHFSGDEFAIQGKTAAEAQAVVERVKGALSKVELTFELPDGSKVVKKGVEFSHGIGQTIEEADAALRANKIAREASGERARRGEAPRGLSERLAAGNEARKREAGGVGGKPPYPVEPPRPKDSPEPTDAQKEILLKIRHEREESKWPRLHDVYTQFIDRLHPIKQAQILATKEGVFDPEKIGPYTLERLNAGIFGKANHFLKKGTYDFDTYQKIGPSYEEALSSVRNDLDGFRAYMASRRAIELHGRGIESGFKLETTKVVVSEGRGKYEEAFKNRLKYKDTLLEQLHKSGVLSDDAVAQMRELNKAHVPFYRFFEDEAPKGTGARAVRNPIKRILGSEREIIDPITSDVKDTFLFITLAEKNAARQEFIKIPGLSEKVKQPIKPIEVLDKESKEILSEHGIDGAHAEPFTIFRALAKLPEKDEIVVFENGKRNIYKVDPEVAAAFNGMDAGSASMFSALMNAPARWMRAGTVLSPDFLPRNLARDALSSLIYAGSHPIKTIKGGISYIKEDEAYQKWIRGGGANATMVSMDKDYIHEHIFDLNQKTGFMGKTWNLVKSPVELLQITGELFENATRLGAVRDELLQNKTKAQIQALAFLSREATVDFSRRGADPFLQKWSYASAFMNPGLQGIDRMFREMKDHPVRMSARAFTAITIPSVLLWYANHDDPRWKDIPDWQRDLFWIIMTDEHIYSFPKPFELGVMFGSLPERLLDNYFTDNPDQLKKFSKSFAQAFLPNVMPSIMAPIIEQEANYSYFLDRPLVSESMKSLLPAYQYTEYTTEFTKALGQMIGSLPGGRDLTAASPMVIDNYIRGWSGGLGNYAVKIADAALRKAGALPDPVKPASTLADIPFVRAFVLRYPSANAQSIQDFYNSYERSFKVIATVKFLAKSGDADAAMKEALLDPERLVRIEGIHQGLGTAHRVIQLVSKNPDMGADEKRQLIDAMYYQMIEMARAGNESLKEVRRTLGERTIH